MTFKLNDSLGFIINKVNTKLKNTFFQILKNYDITPEQWAILNSLSENEGVTPKDLSILTCKDKPNTNRILEKLIIKNLVVRKPHPSDNRAFQIFLTSNGRLMREQLIPKANNLLEDAVTGIESQKINELKQILNQIYKNLENI